MNNPNLPQPSMKKLADAMNKYLIPAAQNTPISQLKKPVEGKSA